MGCVNNIKDALEKNSIEAEVRLEDKTVILKNEEDKEKAIKVIEDKGYKVDK